MLRRAVEAYAKGRISIRPIAQLINVDPDALLEELAPPRLAPPGTAAGPESDDELVPMHFPPYCQNMPSQKQTSRKQYSDQTASPIGAAFSSPETGPQALRAVAHPVRIELLMLLRADGPLTATRCAERLGLTAKVCSYHLQTLGRYGLIEETGEGRGRARPWRLVTSGLSYVYRPGDDDGAAEASDHLARVILARDTRLISEFIAGRHDLQAQWRNVAAMLGDALRLTPGQLKSLGGELAAVLERYAELSRQPLPDAHPVHVALYAVPTELPPLTRPG